MRSLVAESRATAASSSAGLDREHLERLIQGIRDEVEAINQSKQQQQQQQQTGSDLTAEFKTFEATFQQLLNNSGNHLESRSLSLYLSQDW